MVQDVKKLACKCKSRKMWRKITVKSEIAVKSEITVKSASQFGHIDSCWTVA